MVNGHWMAVPKDIMRRRPDGSYVSVGRAGGTVKVKGGVLMSTNVVEQQLQQGPIAAACITDPVHVEGGGSLVLEINWLDVWSMRDCLQRSAFLRLPVLFTCSMPRNASTGKVQKALVQEELIQSAYAAEMASLDELRQTQRAQMDWYLNMSRPALLACLLQPKMILEIAAAVCHLDSWRCFRSVAGILPDAIFQLCLVAWVYSAWAHAAKLTPAHAGVPVLCSLLLGACLGYSCLALLVSSVLLSVVIAFGICEKRSEDSKTSFFRLGRLSFTYAVAFSSRLPLQGLTSQFAFGLLLLLSVSRCLPAARWPMKVASLQRLAAHSLSIAESLIYMLCWPVVFVLGLHGLILAQFPDSSYKQLKQPGQPLAREQKGQTYAGSHRALAKVKSETWSKGSVWVDVESSSWEDPHQEEQVMPNIQAQTPAGVLGQQLARQAGVDFRSVDSLKLARLSVLLKKHLKLGQQKEPLEFIELRDVCTDEQSFVSLIDDRMELAERQEVSLESGSTRGVLSWLQGGCVIHREGATQAPWDCQVDVLVEWCGPSPLDHATLCSAMAQVLRQHPTLRARFPPDDATDSFIGGGRNGFSTTAAATWGLVSEIWSLQRSWRAALGQAIRFLVTSALWQCWPRTLIAEETDSSSVDIPQFSKASDGQAANVADEVYELLGETWDSWWKQSSAWNVCMLTLEQGQRSRQFLYCSVTHKYADGGAAAAFVQALRENYESLAAGEAVTTKVHPVLELQQKRLLRFLSGEPCPEGSVDCYFFDIGHDLFSHDYGHSIGVFFTEQVCETVRQAGLHMACSEEIAWLACITCALCRQMPDEKLIKILMVHNGRMGDAEGAVACVSQYVMLSIPCGDRSNTPLADVASRVKYAVTNGKFRRPATCEQSHAKINIGGMIGSDGHFTQAFKTGRSSKASSWSRAPHVLQLRMDNEGGTWCVKDCKCHQILDARVFWQTAICVANEIKEGWFTNPLTSRWNEEVLSMTPSTVEEL